MGENRRMPAIIYEGRTYQCRDSETVLDALIRQGADVPFSCRNGVCHVCMMRSVSGEVGERATAGIKPSLQALGYFLPCRCRPGKNLELAPPRPDDLYVSAMVAGKEMLSRSVCRLLLEPATVWSYRAGQFVNLRNPQGVARSYSLASVPETDYFLELHVARRENGVLSNWIADELNEGDEVELHGPSGDNFYQADEPERPLLLVGAGTGLAPLWGILRDALSQGHTGPIHVYHGSRQAAGLYLHEELTALAAEHANVHYHPCVSGARVPRGIRRGRADAAARDDHPQLEGWRVHVAGDPAMVASATQAFRQAGAAEADLRADPFELTDLRAGSRDEQPAGPEESYGRRAEDDPATAPWRKPEVAFPPPDPELWAALGEGVLMHEILRTFYTRVYADPLLSPFFRNVTKQRLIEKQYSFLKRAFTGELCYFGDRPRNAHHWMVISDELFDHRLDLLSQAARDHGLEERWIRRWEAAEEIYRPDVVKTRAWPRVVDGVEMTLEGFGEMTLEVGSLCDSCEDGIDAGAKVRYHLRTGETYCAACSALEAR